MNLKCALLRLSRFKWITCTSFCYYHEKERIGAKTQEEQGLEQRGNEKEDARENVKREREDGDNDD